MLAPTLNKLIIIIIIISFQIHFQYILLSHGRSSSSLKQAHCVPQISRVFLRIFAVPNKADICKLEFNE